MRYLQITFDDGTTEQWPMRLGYELGAERGKFSTDKDPVAWLSYIAYLAAKHEGHSSLEGYGEKWAVWVTDKVVHVQAVADEDEGDPADPT